MERISAGPLGADAQRERLEVAMDVLRDDLFWVIELSETSSVTFGEPTEHVVTPEAIKGLEASFQGVVRDMGILAKTVTDPDGLSAYSRPRVIDAVGDRLALIGPQRMALMLHTSSIFTKPPTADERGRVYAADALHHYAELMHEDEDPDILQDDLASAFADVLDADARPLSEIIDTIAANIYGSIIGDPSAKLATSRDDPGYYDRQHDYLRTFLQSTAYAYVLLGHDTTPPQNSSQAALGC